MNNFIKTSFDYKYQPTYRRLNGEPKLFTIVLWLNVKLKTITKTFISNIKFNAYTSVNIASVCEILSWYIDKGYKCKIWYIKNQNTHEVCDLILVH